MTTRNPMTLYPYLLASTWVFDDPNTKLKAEAFVLGASEMIHRLVQAKAIPNAEQGFALSFANEPFGQDVELRWIEPGDAATGIGLSLGSLPSDGYWYTSEVAGEPMTCWLCPALFCYFEEAPERIFAKAEPLPSGVDPIWHEAWQDPGAKRFMSADG